MGSSIKINSISIDLAEAANEVDMVKCDHFSIRGFVAERRERDHRKCWPFSEESLSLVETQSYYLPSLSVPNFRWWRCMSCVRDIDVDGTKDCGLHSNSRTIISEKKLDGNSSVIPIKSKLNSLTIIDHEKENAGNENEDVNYERSQKNDQRINGATRFLKKVNHPRSMDASTVRSKNRKHASPEQVGNKRSKEKVKKSSERQNVDQAAVTTFGSSEIAGVLEDTPPKVIKNHKGGRVLMESDTVSSESINLVMSGGLQRRKTRKIRLLSELLGKTNTKTSGGGSKEEDQFASKRESVRGRKRKLDESNYVSRILSTIGATSENASKSCDDSDHSESTDGGFDRDPIKGKQKNRRFQVVDEFLPPLPCETSQEGINQNNNAVLPAGKSSMQSLFNGKDSVTQRTEKKLKKKKNKLVTDNVKSSTLISFNTGMDEGNQVIKPRSGPSINATRYLLSEKRVFDNRLASEGYFRKPIPQLGDKPVISLHLQDHDLVRSRDAENANCLRDFGSSSKSNTGGWLRTGLDVFDFSDNNTSRSDFANFKLRHTPSSTRVPDLSYVLQKDGADKKGKTVIVQEQDEASRSHSHDRKENTSEEQNDDIPMEIVELMAKNQYERCLPDKEEDVSNKETAHKSKNALLIDLNETYDNGFSMEENNTSREPQPEHFLMGTRTQQKSHDFFPITQPYVPSSSPFGIFPPTQENRGSSIQFSGHNCQWLGNVPTMANQNQSPSSYRVLRACNTCQSVPHQYRDASHPIWPSSMIPPPQGHHHNPVSFNMDQPIRPATLSRASSNENTWNLNFVAANGKQKSGSTSEFSFGCKHAATGANNSNRSIDAFSNESSIPALHLLSLMDPRLRSTTPADHHGNTKFTRRHFPPANNQSKEFVELQTGDSSKTASSTKQLPFDLYRKRFAPETSRKSFPMIPPLGASSFSFQNAQASWSHHHQEKKTKRKDTLPPVYSSGHEKSVFANNSDQGKFQLLGASNSMMLPLKFHMTDKQKRKAESCNNASALRPPLKSGSGEQIVCIVNRNPADFTIAEPGNVYMLTGENLKVRKRATFKKKPSLCKQDALKQTKKPVCPATENA